MDIDEQKNAKEEALAALNRATTLVCNIEGDHWQMAYEVLEAVYNNLVYVKPVTTTEKE